MRSYKNLVVFGDHHDLSYLINWIGDKSPDIIEFDSLTKAKSYAKLYRHTKVYRAYFAPDTGALIFCREFY